MPGSRRKSTRPTKELTLPEFAEWLRVKMGEETMEDFASRLGFKRQQIGLVLAAKRGPGPRLRKALKRYGLHDERKTYLVDVEA